MEKSKEGFVCFDLETTGFGTTAEIIEFGAVKVIDGKIADKFSELVKPEHEISKSISKLTGITNKYVENCRSISEVLPEFLDFVDGYILVGHNIATFDIPIVRNIAKEKLNREFNVYYVDTMRTARKINGIENCKLETLLDHYGLTNENAHRAFQDCEATVKLLKAMRDDGIKFDVKYSCEKSRDPWDEFDDEDKETLDFEIRNDLITDIKGAHIALTGEFESGCRIDVSAALQKAGAQIFEHISSKIDYLIVGGRGSDEWKFNNGGTKITKAKKLNITILSETAVSQILKSNLEETQNV